MDGYKEALTEFEEMAQEKGMAYTLDYWGGGPQSDCYMPDWPESERTHYMMYEDTSEGTPISPAFETPEELAKWLSDNSASSFGRWTATYDQWLGLIKGPGWCPSMVSDGTTIISGVEGLGNET
jgi:hypothetical protein